MGFLHRVAGRGENEGNLELYVAWGRVAVLFIVLGVSTYLSLASGIWYYMRHSRDYKTVTWADVAWPGNWAAMRVKQGDELISKVDGLFAARDYYKGFHYLQAGVRLSPANLDGRAMLAAIQRQIGRRDLSARTLEGGWDHAGSNIDYLGAVLQAQLALQQEERVIELGKEWFAQADRNREADVVILFAWATALGNLRYPDEAMRLVQTYGLDATDAGIALVAQILWTNDRQKEATDFLSNAISRFPNSEMLFSRLAAYQRELGRISSAEATLFARWIAQPDNPIPHLDLLWWYYDQKKMSDVERLATSFLERFGNQKDAVVAFATGASARGQMDLLERAIRHQESKQWNEPVFILARVEGLVSAGLHREAVQEIQRIQRSREPWLESFSNPLTSYGMIAQFALGSSIEGENLLQRLLSGNRITSSELQTVAMRLVSLNLDTVARRVLRRALQLEPDSQQALALLIDLELGSRNTDGLPEVIDRILARRRPPLTSLDRARNALESDFSVFTPGRLDLLARVEEATARVKTPQPLPQS